MIGPEKNINIGGVVKLEIVPIANAVSVREKDMSCVLIVTEGFTPVEVYSTYKSIRAQVEPNRSDGGSSFPTEIRWLVPQDRVALWESILPYLHQYVLLIATLTDGNQRLYGTVDFPLLLSAKHSPFTTPDSFNGAEVTCNGSDLLPGRFLINTVEYVEEEEPDPVDTELQVMLRTDQVVLSSGRVTQMTDQTGNEYHAVTNFGYAGPELISNYLNGKPVLDFDNGSSNMSNVGLKISSNYFGKTSLWACGTNGISETDAYTMFLVAKHNDSHSDTIRLIGNGNMEFQFGQYTGSDCIKLSYKGDPTTFLTKLRAHDSNFHIWTIAAQDGECKVYLDGVLLWEPELVEDTEKTGDLLLGIKIDESTISNKFMMAELRIYDVVVSTTKFNNVIAELKSYYAIE